MGTADVARASREAIGVREPLEVVISRLDCATLDRPIEGQWVVEPSFRPSPAERTFGTPFIIVHVGRQGCAYFPSEALEHVRSQCLVGRSVAECLVMSQHVRVAVADAAYGIIADALAAPQETVVLDGTVTQKAHQRAGLVCREVRRQIGRTRGRRVALVGYSGEIASQLHQAGFAVSAYDFDDEIIGHSADYLSTSVEHGHALYSQDAPHLIVASGMTLVTETFSQLALYCQSTDAKLIMYCQTGANLGAALAECGATVVISEHVPFYNWEGPSRVSIHVRR